MIQLFIGRGQSFEKEFNYAAGELFFNTSPLQSKCIIDKGGVNNRGGIYIGGNCPSGPPVIWLHMDCSGNVSDRRRFAGN